MLPNLKARGSQSTFINVICSSSKHTCVRYPASQVCVMRWSRIKWWTDWAYMSLWCRNFCSSTLKKNPTKRKQLHHQALNQQSDQSPNHLSLSDQSDLSLSAGDGVEVCSCIPQHFHVHPVVLTAKGEENKEGSVMKQRNVFNITEKLLRVLEIFSSKEVPLKSKQVFQRFFLPVSYKISSPIKIVLILYYTANFFFAHS